MDALIGHGPDETIISFDCLTFSELEAAKVYWYAQRALTKTQLAACEGNMKEKLTAANKIEDRLRILSKVLRKELDDEISSLAKYKQIKEAIYNTEALLEGIQPPIDKLESDIAEVKQHMSAVESNIKLVNAEIKSRGKVIKSDRFRSQKED